MHISSPSGEKKKLPLLGLGGSRERGEVSLWKVHTKEKKKLFWEKTPAGLGASSKVYQ